MREIIDILETVEDQSAHLYHGTSITGFCHIAKSNKLGAYGGEDQASFTLSADVAKKFSKNAVSACGDGQLVHYSDFHGNDGDDGKMYVAYKAEMIAGGGGMVMAFDRSSLHRNFEFHSVGFDSPGLERIDWYSGSEQEECVFSDVVNLDRYLTGVLIDRDGFRKYCEFVRAQLPDDANAIAAIAAGEAWVNRFS